MGASSAPPNLFVGFEGATDRATSRREKIEREGGREKGRNERDGRKRAQNKFLVIRPCRSGLQLCLTNGINHT